MADAGPLAAAIAERDNVVRLIANHERKCNDQCCCLDRLSLGAHLARTQAQVDLLTPPETEAMFDG